MAFVSGSVFRSTTLSAMKCSASTKQGGFGTSRKRRCVAAKFGRTSERPVRPARRARTEFDEEQRKSLEKAFEEEPYPGFDGRMALSNTLDIPESRIQVCRTRTLLLSACARTRALCTRAVHANLSVNLRWNLIPN